MDAVTARTLLRGLYRVGSDESIDAINVNIRALADAVESRRLKLRNPDYQAIYRFALEYSREHLEPPDVDDIKRYYSKLPSENAITVIETVDDIRATKLITRTSYRHALKVEIESQKREASAAAFEKAAQIARKKVVIGEGKTARTLDGVEDALGFATELVSPLCGGEDRQVRADTWQEGEDVLLEYMAAKRAPPGVKVGLAPIDDCFQGLRPGEMWIHAAPTGQLKTSLALNWAYHASVELGLNVLYVSLEMTAEQLRRLSYALHSSHPAWERQGLDYSAVRSGTLTPADEAFLLRVAGQAKSLGGKLLVWAPTTVPTVQEIVQYAEMVHRTDPVSLVIVDHSLLVRPSSKDRDHLTRVNSIFTDAKRGALAFSRGAGVPVVLLHQINREGSRAAAKGGALSTFHLASANEAERSADMVTWSLVTDDLRARSRVQIGCIKNREGAQFSAFEAMVNFPSRRITYRNLETASDLGFEVEAA